MDLLVPGPHFSYSRAKELITALEWPNVQLSLFYIAAIFGGQYLMRDRKAFDSPSLTRALNIWNAILAVFSTLGFVGVTPAVLRTAWAHGFSAPYTRVSEVHTDWWAGYWTLLWVLSKMPELVDTVFLVLRKRRVMLMHWYHHAFTGYVSIVCYRTDSAFLVPVVWINYGIHSAMYSYYMVRSMGIPVSAKIAQTLTTAQMVQFVLVMLGQLHVALNWLTVGPNSADGSVYGWALCFFMVASYFVLWIRFYRESYLRAGQHNKYDRNEKQTKAAAKQH